MKLLLALVVLGAMLLPINTVAAQGGTPAAISSPMTFSLTDPLARIDHGPLYTPAESQPVDLGDGGSLVYLYRGPDVDSTTVSGELQNGTYPAVMQLLLLDSSGDILSSTNVSANNGYVEPGVRVPFFLGIPVDPALVASFAVVPCHLIGTALPSAGFSVESTAVGSGPRGASVTGKARNTKSIPTSGAVTVAAYDSVGVLIGVTGKPIFDDVQPGQAMAFDIPLQFLSGNTLSSAATIEVSAGQNFGSAVTCDTTQFPAPLIDSPVSSATPVA